MIVALKRDYTQVFLSPDDQEIAENAAMYVTASPHEWVWTPREQELMARYVLWAHQRLEAIAGLAGHEQLKHEPPVVEL